MEALNKLSSTHQDNEGNKVTLIQILKEARTYVGGEVLKRALISISIIVMLGITISFFVQ